MRGPYHGRVTVERTAGGGAGPPDPESRGWVQGLDPASADHDAAVARLREVLLRVARHELGRRRGLLGSLSGPELDDLAEQAANDALMNILAKVEHFRGASRFTTWAYKFALLEAAVKLRRRAWQGREIPIEAEHWSVITDQGAAPELDAESGELLSAIQRAIDDDLSAHQREVLVALALNGVPIDVLADRLGTTRGALYKTLHDARKKLRRVLVDAGLPIESG